MKRSLLFIIFIVFAYILQAQKDSSSVVSSFYQKEIIREAAAINISIYPVPVRDNSFTIRCDREMSFVKITNIIGQDILRLQYNTPQDLVKIFLDNPKRGMYLVTIIFSDRTRVVKKIMVEESD